MGYLTTITIGNDQLDTFEKNPKEFAEAIFKGIDRANMTRKECNMPFRNTIGYLTVQPSRHADDATIYLHSGNMLTDLNAYSQSFEELYTKNPELAKSLIATAKDVIKWSEKRMKDLDKTIDIQTK